MAAVASPSSLKVVGTNGQISLGKRFAGRQVLVEERGPGVWLVRTATVVPDNESWLHQPKAAADLQKAVSWAQNNVPGDSSVDAVIKKLARG